MTTEQRHPIKWHEYMVPVLRVVSDGKVWVRADLIDAVAVETGLTKEEKSVLLDSGELSYRNRISWAMSYLGKADAIKSPARATFEITDVGRRLLAEYPNGISHSVLKSQPEYKAKAQAKKIETPAVQSEDQDLDPVEQINVGIAQVHQEVAADLLQRLHAQSPGFFEQAVVDLVVAMGYGGSDLKATRTQLTNDNGIDGIIDQDILGLSRVFIQAKRYAPDNAVQRPDIQSFVGALHGQQVDRGVFITTGRFTTGAIEYADSVATRIVLIDGERLAELMIRHRVGVQVKRSLEIVEVDEDFFE